jgi:DNA-directed RNA polymerase subunit M/transcription elongation factor TFIIS
MEIFMAQASCGNNHSWIFTGKQKTNDKYPNYYYKCTKCGTTGWAEQSGAPIKAYG